MEVISPQTILHALDYARRYDGSSSVSLTHEGRRVWNEAVAPAVESALPRAIDGAFAYPYFAHLRPENQAGIVNADAYDMGVNFACSDEGRGIAPNLALAKRHLSNGFFCERSRVLQGEPANEAGWVDGLILKKRLEETLRDYEIPLDAQEDFQAGVVAGAVKLVLNSLTTSR